jgi:CDP-paratose 2-epimerase
VKVLVTGCSGLIGSAAVRLLDKEASLVLGVDNNMRREFFGPAGDTTWNLRGLLRATRHFRFRDLDVRNREGVAALLGEFGFDLVLHCAAQPSHDKAREIPLVDFDVNAGGTLNLLEATRQHCKEAVFIQMSTNKVYGDAPNELPMVELPTRFDYARSEDHAGISEMCRVDRSLHSIFGASKLAADILAQEYGRSFGLKVGVFRAGCVTGSAHSGVELHGFLSHLIRVAVSKARYTVFGYKGKQVRDQLHCDDVISAFRAFAEAPRAGEVYNLGGGRENSASLKECLDLVQEELGASLNWSYDEQPRRGDHICYISDTRKLRTHYPQWQVTRSLGSIVQEMIDAEQTRAHS